MAKAIVDTFEAEDAPPRLALGPDVYGYIKAALTSRLEQIEAYKNLTMSTELRRCADPLAYGRCAHRTHSGERHDRS